MKETTVYFKYLADYITFNYDTAQNISLYLKYIKEIMHQNLREN